MVILVYNADKKELIAMFKTYRAAVIFIYGKYCNLQVKSSNIRYYLKSKTSIKKSDLPFRIALRRGDKIQEDEVGDSEYLIMSDELKSRIKSTDLLRFRDNAESLRIEHTRRPIHPNTKIANSVYNNRKKDENPLSSENQIHEQ